MTGSGSFRLTQGYDVLPIKAGNAYPVPCDEWDNLKTMMSRLSTEPWLFHTLGSLLLGAGISTGIASALGGVKADPTGRLGVIAWAIAGVCILLGSACMYFANRERSFHRERAADIVAMMNVIENRYDQSSTTARAPAA